MMFGYGLKKMNLNQRECDMGYEFVQPTDYCGDDGNTEVFLYKE